jgi:hypothetical protein
MAGQPDKLDKQISAVDKLTASIGALTAKFTALTEKGESWNSLQDKIGSSVDRARLDFIKLVESSEKVAKAFAADGNAAAGTSERIADLQKKVKSLDSTYSTLVNKTLRELRKEQSAYKAQLKELTDQEKAASQQERAIIKQRQAAARQALKDIKERIAQERADKKRLYDEETKQIKELLRLQKNRLTQIEQEEKKNKKAELDAKRQSKQRLTDLAKENLQRERNAKKAERDLKRFGEEAARARQKTLFFGQSFRDAFSPQAIGKAIASIVKFIGIYEVLNVIVGSVVNFFKDSVRSFIDFDEKLARISAVTGAAGKELNSLEQSIRKVAVETRFTANDISELTISLGKLGVSAREIPNLLSPIAQASQATGEDLTNVGESILKVTNQFGLSTEQAAATAAILVGAVNESALSLEGFNVAIGYVGPIANQAGLSLEETATALGILSDNGFSASRSGTGLRRILLDLKKPGEDITETLDELAKKNIGVAEAEELVGKQGVAQLLVILDNIEALKEASVAEAGYAELLSATATQMSSVSGQVDILKSAYTDLLITVGDFLVSNELILELIGFLSDDSEKLARGYKLLSERNKELGDSFNQIIEGGLSESLSAFDILKQLLADIDDDNIKALLRTIDESDAKSVEEIVEVLEKVRQGVIIPRPVSGIQGFKQFVMGKDFDEEVLSVLGALERVNEPIISKATNDVILKNKNAIIRANQSEVNSILAIKNANDKKQKSEDKSREFQADINKLKKTQLDLAAKDFKGSANQRLQIEGQIQGLQALRKQLSEVEKLEKKKNGTAKDATDIYKNEFNLRLKSFEIERKGIEDSQKDAKKAFDFRIKQIEDEFKVKEAKAATEAELIEILAQKREEEKRVIDSYSEELAIYADKTADLTTRSAEFFDEFTGKFKGSEENTQNLINKLDQWAASIANLAQANSELGLDAQLTVIKEASQLYEDGSKAIDLFSDRLKGLEGQYKKTEYGQINLSIAQKKYIEDVRNELAESLDDYNRRFAALSVAVGEDVAKKILQPFADVSDALVKKLNQAIKDGTLSDETIQEIKKKLVSLRGTIEDGIGEDDIILKIDITPQEVIKAALDETLKAIERFNDVAFENTKNRLDRELEKIGNSAEIEDEILQAKLENQLISEAEYRAQIEKNRRKEVQATNKIEKQIFDAEQKRDRQGALVDYLTALSSIVPNLIVREKKGDPITISLMAAITGALATVSYGAQVRAINQRKFYPTKFAEGGIVSGPSHSEGGVPFTVRGQGGYEMEGGEYVVNKKSTQKYKSLLDQINGYGKSNYKFAAGGVVKDPTEVANRQLELLEAIASSNISMVGKLDKPVRAFVASNDLRSDENARRIQERNAEL